MNDDIREKLSAYLDGALTDSERRAVELEVSRSEEMRLELESLRAVSSAVKGLPKEKLPAGFAARLEARRAREDAAPAREHYILPPSYRPLAFALSSAVVALVIWDRTVTRPDPVVPYGGWDSDRVAVKSAAEAPASIDVSGQLSALSERANDEPAKKEDAGNTMAGAPSTHGKQISAPGKPLEVAEADAAPARAGAGGGEKFGALSAAESLDGTAQSGAFLARNEEERSAINERLYKGFEQEKKRMGIAKIVDKDTEEPDLQGGGREYMTMHATPEAPRLDRSRSVASVRGAARSKAGAPAFRAIALKSAEALSAAWAAAGLPGEPPAVAFPEQMALFLAGPSGSGIVEVRVRKNTILVLYKGEGFDDPSARVRAVAASPKPVLIKLAQ